MPEKENNGEQTTIGDPVEYVARLRSMPTASACLFPIGAVGQKPIREPTNVIQQILYISQLMRLHPTKNLPNHPPSSGQPGLL